MKHMVGHESVEYRKLRDFVSDDVASQRLTSSQVVCCGDLEGASAEEHSRSRHSSHSPRSCSRVKNLLAKVDVLGLKPFLLARHFASRPANLLRLESGLVGLQHDVIVPIDVVDAKVVVIRAGQDVASSVSF
jgi:hypothetical protein